MNLKQLECFYTLTEEMNFTRASERLYMSQPPFSRQIKLLESDLDVKLFNRTKRKVSLTPEGKYLQKEVSQILAHIRKIKMKLPQIKEGISGSISIAYIGSAMHSVLPNLLKTFCEKYPDIQVSLHEMTNQQQVDALENNKIDIAFLRTKQKSSSIELIEIHSEPFSLILPNKLNFELTKKKDMDMINNMPFIGFEKNSCSVEMVNKINRILHKMGLFPQQEHESSQINSILKIVESGLGYSILPESVKNESNNGLKYFSLKQFKETALLYLGINRSNQSKVISNFMETAKIKSGFSVKIDGSMASA